MKNDKLRCTGDKLLINEHCIWFKLFMKINFNNLVTPQYFQTEKIEHEIEYIQYPGILEEKEV